MKCRRCGTELRSDDEFCYRCGERTTVFQRMVASRMFAGSVIAVILAVIVSVGAWLILTDRVEIPWFEKNEKVSAGDETGQQDTGAVQTELPAETETPEPSPTPYVFVPSDVTKEKKKEMKPLLARVKPFLAFSASYYADGSHAFKWDDVSATTLAMYELRNDDKKIRTGDAFSFIKRAVKKEMKEVFGDAWHFDLTYSGVYPDYVYVKSGNTVVYNAVGISGKVYRMEPEAIVEYKEGKFCVVVNACLEVRATKQKGDTQKYTLWIRENEESRYGYTIDKIRLYKKGDRKVSR